MRLDNRNKFLLFGFMALLFLSYQLAIKKTIDLHADYLANLEYAELSKNIPVELAKLSQKENHLDTLFQLYNRKSSSLHNDLLQFLNENGKGRPIKIIDIMSAHRITESTSKIHTYPFILEGGFLEILQLAHVLETKGSFGGINHLAFEKKLDYRSKKHYLRAIVHLQQVE